jgi:hypothetical protein
LTGLTGFLAAVAEVAGESAATRLALAAGGTRLTFSAAKNSTLVRIVGLDAAQKIVGQFGRETYTIPMAHLRGQKGRQAAAAKMLASGANASEVARACDVHERTARRVRKRMAQAKQAGLPLFPES